MKKYLIFGLLIAMIFSVGVVMAAKPDFQAAKITNPVTEEPKNTVTIPAKAIEVAPNIFYLGTAIENGKVVEGYAFIDCKKGFGKPTGCNYDGTCQGWEDPTCVDCAGGGEEPDTSSCYGFLANGAKWRTTESYVVDSDIDALAIEGDLDTWDSQVTFEVFGNRDTSSVVDEADLDSPDGKNEVMFEEISSPGAIAVAIVWGVFRGPPFARELVEWDVVFDDVDYNWGYQETYPPDTVLMDFENIATHEFGHAAGLDDLYTAECLKETMYGYADYGEIKKRTLEAGDIRGVQELYK